jgi:glycosyltransferase involved in cell wall biosynthesis
MDGYFMRSPINIVFLSPGFAADENDSTSIPSLQHLARYIKTHYPAIELTIITFQYPYQRGGYSWNGINVWSAGGKKGRINRILTWIRAFHKIQIINHQKRIDLIHAFWLTEATFIGKIFSLIYNVPLLATAMGQDVKPENHYLTLFRYLSLNLNLISDYQSSFLQKIKRLTIMNVIPFGIDEVFYAGDKNIRTIDILGAGSLNPVKDFGLFVRIISDLSGIFPDIRCMIIGEGSERRYLEALIRKEHLEKNMELAGELDYEIVISRMHQARVFLHTSSFEGQGLVITEALAAGMQVVSFPVGIAETLKSRKLFTGRNREELTDHLIRLLRENNNDFIPEIHFTISDTCSDYLAVYEKLMN